MPLSEQAGRGAVRLQVRAVDDQGKVRPEEPSTPAWRASARAAAFFQPSVEARPPDGSGLTHLAANAAWLAVFGPAGVPPPDTIEPPFLLVPLPPASRGWLDPDPSIEPLAGFDLLTPSPVLAATSDDGTHAALAAADRVWVPVPDGGDPRRCGSSPPTSASCPAPPPSPTRQPAPASPQWWPNSPPARPSPPQARRCDTPRPRALAFSGSAGAGRGTGERRAAGRPLAIAQNLHPKPTAQTTLSCLTGLSITVTVFASDGRVERQLGELCATLTRR